MRNKYCNILFLIFVTTQFNLSCNTNNKSTVDKTKSVYKLSADSVYQTSIPKYEIINISVNNKVKTVASIRITNKLSDDELRLIALKAKSDLNPASDRVHLFFLLPEMKDKNGAWARADFNPALQIYILGQTIASQNSIRNYKDQKIENEILGQWIDDYKGEFIYRMRLDPQQGLVLELYSPAENKVGPFPAILKKIKKKGKTIYIDTDSPNQYFIINAKGDLVAYDETGYIITYKKL